MINIQSSQIAEIQPEDPDTLIALLKSLPELKTLYMYGNDVIRNIRNYRKLLIVEIEDLR
jgi:Leucine-rich repeat (LRR) protein